MNIKYRNYPCVWWQYPLFIIGFVLFWALSPVWAVLYLTGSPDVPFVMVHIQAMFYNLWSS